MDSRCAAYVSSSSTSLSRFVTVVCWVAREAFKASSLLERFDKVLEIMLPTLGPDRRATYSPFMPISPKSGKVLQVPTLERNLAKGSIVFEDEDGEKQEIGVTGGQVKVQWKPDWALRWAALVVANRQRLLVAHAAHLSLSTQRRRGRGDLPPPDPGGAAGRR